MAIKVKVDTDKLRQDILREMKRLKKEGIDGLPSFDREQIGEDVIELMKETIAKGLSPVFGWGRFPEYKNVRGARKAASASQKKGLAALKGAKGKGATAARALVRSRAASIKARAYPYSVQDKFPGKRERPVNLLLSGDFLNALRARATSTGLAIGFFARKEALKEQGHREGANGQPMRPTIPIEGEAFTRTIQQRLLTSIRFRVLAHLGKISR